MDLIVTLQVLGGLVLLLGGAELLVRGAAGLARVVGISPLVVGLTVVAFGTSSPEIAVGIAAAAKGQGGLALGNVVGSNVFNLLVVLGLSAVVAPLVIGRQVLRFDLPVLVAATVGSYLACLDGRLTRVEGAVLFLLLLTYLIHLIRLGRDLPGNLDDLPRDEGPSPNRAVLALLAVAGLVTLVLGSRWLVAGAVSIATALGVSELVIGLTVVAVGTSLPEVAASVVATRRGEREIAVGNAVGSNLFNLLGVLGLSALLAPRAVAVDPDVLAFDGPVMLAVTLVCVPIFWRDRRIDRWEGWLLLAYYGAYLGYVLLDAGEHPALPMYRAVLAVALPASVMGVMLALWRSHRAGGTREGSTA